MKLSSVSFIAAVLAGIADSALAAPGPLHARASEDVNSFDGRDLDVYSGLALPGRSVDDGFSDYLFTRAPVSGEECTAEEGALISAKAHKTAIEEHSIAKERNLDANAVTWNYKEKADEHQTKMEYHGLKAAAFEKAAEDIRAKTATPTQIRQAHSYKNTVKLCNQSIEHAKESATHASNVVKAYMDRIWHYHQLHRTHSHNG